MQEMNHVRHLPNSPKCPCVVNIHPSNVIVYGDDPVFTISELGTTTATKLIVMVITHVHQLKYLL